MYEEINLPPDLAVKQHTAKMADEAVAVSEHEARHARTVEAARARYAEQSAATATSWRKCVRSWCEALLPPESFERYCDPCNEKDRALLARAFGED